MPAPAPRHVALDEVRFVVISGRDATVFLNAQLGIDVAQLGADRAPLAAWHNAKGRVRALVRIVPLADGWLLLASSGAEQDLCRGLGMFVLRADVTIAEDGAWRGAAVLDADADWLAALDVALPAEHDRAAAAGDIVWIRIAPGLVYALARSEAALAPILVASEAAPPAALELAEIRLGLPRVGPGLAEKYLPQMLDLDRLGAVSYTKGCYPGQEVIARTHNLGTVKRRLRRFAGGGPAVPAPGGRVIDAAGVEVGEVVRAAPLGETDAGRGTSATGFELLAVVQVAALEGGLAVEIAARRGDSGETGDRTAETTAPAAVPILLR